MYQKKTRKLSGDGPAWIPPDRRFTPFQARVYKAITESDKVIHVINAHRGAGKSYGACILAATKALEAPNTHVKIISDTQKHVRTIVRPIFNDLFRGMPRDLAPKFNALDGVYSFPSGATITSCGADFGRADSSRGTATHWVIYDEFMYTDNVEYAHYGVILPRLSLVGGKAIFISTPPRSPASPAMKFVEEAQRDGVYIKYTIDDNPDITPEQRARMADAFGGERSTAFRREFLCEFITEEKYAVLPQLIHVPTLVQRRTCGPFSDEMRFISMALNYSGNTVCLFCEHSKALGLFIRESALFVSSTPEEISEGIHSTCTKLWGMGSYPIFAYATKEVCEATTRATGMPLVTCEDDLSGVIVPALRQLVSGRFITVCADAGNLFADMNNAVFDDNMKIFDRDSIGGRFESITALGIAASKVQHFHVISRESPGDRYKRRVGLNRAFLGVGYKGERRKRILG